MRLTALFVASFLLASFAIRMAIPPDPDFVWHPTLTAKIDHLRTTDEHYEVVLVGDSRAFRGLDPILIGDELDRLGCPASVYNLGSVAMSKMEYDQVMGELERAPGGTPEIVVVVDALPLLAGLLKDFSVRQRVHMTAQDFAKYLEYKANLPAEDFGTDPLELADTAAGFLVNQIPVGAVPQHIFKQPALEDEADLVSIDRGFQPWSEFYDEVGDEGLANLFATLAPELENGGWEQRWAVESPDPERIDKWIATLDALMAEIPDESTGVEVFIPSYYDEGTIRAVQSAWQERGRTAPFINLVDRDLVGDYDDPAFFIDYWHLSQLGGDRVSTALGPAAVPHRRT